MAHKGLRSWTLLDKYKEARCVTVGTRVFVHGSLYWDDVYIEVNNSCRFFRQVSGPPLDDTLCKVIQQIHIGTQNKQLHDVWDLVDNSTSGGGSGDVAASPTDTTPGTLTDKLVAGTNVAFTLLNPGGNEQLKIDALGTVSSTEFAVNPATTGTIVVASGAAGQSIVGAEFTVLTPFDGTPTFNLGDQVAGNILPSTEIDFSLVGNYTLTIQRKYLAAFDVVLRGTSGGSTTGTGTVTFLLG